MILVTGRIVELIFILIVLGAILYFMQAAAAGNPPSIRRLPQVDVIDELVARAVEMNKEIWFLSGRGPMTDAFILPSILSTFGILDYVTEKCARFGAKIHHPSVIPDAYNIQAEIMREAYERADRLEDFDPLETIIFIPYGAERPYVIQESWARKPAAAVMCGFWRHAAILFSEALQRAGAVTLAGTDTIDNIAFMVAANNYSMIGEEMYAMSAYLSRDPIMTSALVGQDIGKYICILMIILGTLFGIVGMPFAPWLQF
jgi:hypothetical protein